MNIYLKYMLKKICIKFLYQQNSKETRNNLINELHEIRFNRYKFKDITSLDDIYSNRVVLLGTSKRNKEIKLTIRPNNFIEIDEHLYKIK